ncbi:MAG: reductive dehalogenase [Candidatus Odinarchaeota archaeon]
MLVQKDVCNPTACNLECLSACIRIYGQNTPLQILKHSTPPTINEDRCTGCLACIRACPLDAIIVNDKQKSLRIPQKVLSSTKINSSHSNPSYRVADNYTRMSEADTIFARVQFDTDFQYYHQTEFSGAEHMISKNIPGYERFELELSIAAWNLYDSRHSIRRPGIGLDPEAEESGGRTDLTPEEYTTMVKKAARFFGADLVGIAELDQKWLYTHNRRGEPYKVPKEFKRTVVMGIEMDYDAIATSPTFTSSATTGLGYSMMAFVETELVSFIQRLGYNAMPCGNDVGMSVPMAIDAGLGQYGRHGLVITKSFGPRIRIAKILTDLPLLTDSPDQNFCRAVIRFCETCEKCADNCPSNSIPFGKEQTWNGKTKSNNSGIEKWYVNVETCYGFWIENGSECSNCIRSCPYNKRNGILHRTILWVIQNLPWFNRFIVKLDDIAGYGKQRHKNRFWRKYMT